MTLLPAMLISMIGVYHVIASSRDQFVLNVLQGEGHAHQVHNIKCLDFNNSNFVKITLYFRLCATLDS